jgi:hypothetical protein
VVPRVGSLFADRSWLPGAVRRHARPSPIPGRRGGFRLPVAVPAAVPGAVVSDADARGAVALGAACLVAAMVIVVALRLRRLAPAIA